MDEIDETERQREAAMEIIAKAGAARSCAFAAIHRAKAFDFGGAAEQLDEAERYATEAHKVHTELLVREAGGQQTDGGLLVAHAQDHFYDGDAGAGACGGDRGCLPCAWGDKRRQSMKILLVCSAGMSTDILRGELIKYAKKEQLPLEVKAVGVHAYKEYCTGYDVILLGPQIAYRREKIAAECGNLPVLAIAPGDYAAGNAAHILEQVENTLRGLDE
ncbi:MAG: PTS lactose/cellobiose transporter subunit IIA [Roseburia hominis]